VAPHFTNVHRVPHSRLRLPHHQLVQVARTSLSVLFCVVAPFPGTRPFLLPCCSRAPVRREMTCFSDFPFRPSTRRFPTGQQLEAYLADYAAHFDLMQCIRLRTEVISLRRAPQGPAVQTKEWLVTYRDCMPHLTPACCVRYGADADGSNQVAVVRPQLTSLMLSSCAVECSVSPTFLVSLVLELFELSVVVVVVVVAVVPAAALLNSNSADAQGWIPSADALYTLTSTERPTLIAIKMCYLWALVSQLSLLLYHS